MVARPPVSGMAVAVEPMRLDDLPAVQEIEGLSFTTPWPPHAYRNELETNRLATYLVVRAGDRVVAYGGMWLMVDEAHITTFAVHPRWRRRHVAERLLLGLLDRAVGRHAREATLEVRLSNIAARRLYEKYGFRPVGIRPKYYTDDNEDALIMTTDPLEAPAMTARLERLRGRLAAEPPTLDEPESESRSDLGSERRSGAEPESVSRPERTSNAPDASHGRPSASGPEAGR